ncbi:MAG: integrase, partial [Nitrospira sp.]|nr:integrase [Nitrospira sp.]MBM4147262.1 integrase [Nitrospira sp.]
MNTLREKMLAELQLRGITPRTQTKYLREVSNFAHYFKKSPEELGEEEVKKYLVHLLED